MSIECCGGCAVWATTGASRLASAFFDRSVHEVARGRGATIVCLDSNHTHEHVLAELSAYAPLVTPDSYCVVFDTAVEDMPADSFPDRPWGQGNNPKTAVWEFLKSHSEFEIDRDITHKLQITVAPDGFLRRVRQACTED